MAVTSEPEHPFISFAHWKFFQIHILPGKLPPEVPIKNDTGINRQKTRILEKIEEISLPNHRDYFLATGPKP